MKKLRKKIIEQLQNEVKPSQIVPFLKKNNITPVIVNTGELKFRAPVGLIDSELKAEILKFEKDILTRLYKENQLSAKKATTFSHIELTKKELIAVAKKHKAIRINDFLSSDDLDDYIENEAESKPFLIHEGDLKVEGRFVSTGAVLIVEGNLTVNGCISTLSKTFNHNYIFVTGDVYCQNLVTIRDSVLVIGGNLTVINQYMLMTWMLIYK